MFFSLEKSCKNVSVPISWGSEGRQSNSGTFKLFKCFFPYITSCILVAGKAEQEIWIDVFVHVHASYTFFSLLIADYIVTETLAIFILWINGHGILFL